MVVAYKVPRLFGWLLRQIVTTKWVSLPNITLDQGIVPECLQGNCNPQAICRALIEVHKQPHLQKQAFQTLDTHLRAPKDFDQAVMDVVETLYNDQHHTNNS